MKIKLKKERFIENNFFRPVWFSIFFNPYFISRFSLYREIKKFARTTSTEDKILDVGCGKKPYRFLFKTENYLGIDIVGGGHNDQEKTVDRYFDGETIPFENNRFDLAICTQVLEHTRHPQQLLSEISRVLKPKGRLFLAVPFVWNEHEIPYDFYRLTRYELRHLCNENGLQIDQITSTTGVFGVIGQLLSAFLYESVHFPGTIFKALLSSIVLGPIQMTALIFDYLTGRKWITLDYVIIAKKND